MARSLVLLAALAMAASGLSCEAASEQGCHVGFWKKAGTHAHADCDRADYLQLRGDGQALSAAGNVSCTTGTTRTVYLGTVAQRDYAVTGTVLALPADGTNLAQNGTLTCAGDDLTLVTTYPGQWRRLLGDEALGVEGFFRWPQADCGYWNACYGGPFAQKTCAAAADCPHATCDTAAGTCNPP